ncbi:AAA family ATPase [Streptomyces sp. NBRC 110611]|uniref:AAA family ATPase n=1 Tax=Streptomyces sp. NBRC 110611 TaxID=1621259 RepID=UPI00082ADA48|nr:AAA family ATPase [Streptomyces sp. NBRC 110611]
MALLAAEAARARAGTGRMVLVRGATGTGRTSVLEAAADDATAAGMRVLRARCSPGDTAHAFSAVLQLLGLSTEFTGLPPGVDERSTSARLWRLLASYADEGPLLLAVDDVHLADRSSRQWLTEATRRLDRLPVLLAVTERSQYDVDPPLPGIAHTLPPALVRSCTLAPLGTGSAAELVRSACPDAPEAWAEDCVRAGAGSPLLLLALLEDLGEVPAAGPVPESCAALYPGAYPAAVAWWLDSTGLLTAEVARMLAALDEGWAEHAPAGHPAPYPGPSATAALAELLAGPTGADPARVAGWLTAMTRLGVLRPAPDGRPRYAHALLRDAVLADVPVARRQAAHRAAAEEMLRRGARAETVARQLMRTGPVGEPWALTVLVDAAALAARDARRPGDPVAFLRRALEEPMPDADRQRLLTRLGSLEHAARDASAGLSRFAEALRLEGTPQGRVHAAVALGTALVGRGKVRDAVDQLRELDGELTDRPDLVRTVQTASALLSDHDQGVRREVYRWLTETAERSPELLGAAGQMLMVRYASTAGLTSAEKAMKRVRDLLAEPADPLTEPFLLGTAAAVAQWADELDEAERLVERGLAGQHAALLHPMHEAILNTGIDIAAARGDYARLLGAPDALDTEAGHAGPCNRHGHVLIALVETGRMAQAERLVAAFDLAEAPDSWELNRFLYARGVLRAAAADPPGALHDFLECGRRQSAREVISPVVTPWRTAAAECCLALHNPREAVALAEEELRLAQVWDTPRTVGRALRVLAMATGGRHGLKLASEAVDTLRTVPSAESELLPALITEGRALSAAGDRARARDCLQEAAERAERRGAVRHRTLAEQALRDLGARHRHTPRTGPSSLTDGERRIAELAATGHTNSEIAALLHLARRTVETHLTSTYRKLGIRSRGELREALLEDR